MTIEPGFLLAQGVATIGVGIGAYISVVQRITKLESTKVEGIEARVATIEAVLRLISEKAAKMLHSPHDPYGLDGFLEKYIDHNYDLTDSEWAEFDKILIKVQEDNENSMDAKIYAMLVQTLSEFSRRLAEHKMQRNQLNKKP